MLQVARAGRFGTKGLSITFVADETDAKVLNSVQDRFEVNITELPDEIDVASYSELGLGCRRALLKSACWGWGIGVLYLESPTWDILMVCRLELCPSGVELIRHEAIPSTALNSKPATSLACTHWTPVWEALGSRQGGCAY